MIHRFTHSHLFYNSSPSTATMSLNNWKTTRSKSISLGRKGMQREYNSHPKWLIFWRRITKLKNPTSDSCTVQKTYDHQSYIQNFDEGFDGAEPDNLYRSFSARYADPAFHSCTHSYFPALSQLSGRFLWLLNIRA